MNFSVINLYVIQYHEIKCFVIRKVREHRRWAFARNLSAGLKITFDSNQKSEPPIYFMNISALEIISLRQSEAKQRYAYGPQTLMNFIRTEKRGKLSNYVSPFLVASLSSWKYLRESPGFLPTVKIINKKYVSMKPIKFDKKVRRN